MSAGPRRGERRTLAAAFAAALADVIAETGIAPEALDGDDLVAVRAIERLKAGTRQPSLDALFVIAAAFHIPVEHLVARTAIYLELAVYEHEVPIFFQRGPRVFRVAHPSGKEEGCYDDWRQAVAVAKWRGLREIVVYSRVGRLGV